MKYAALGATDDIPATYDKHTSEVLAVILQRLFTSFLLSGVCSAEYKCSYIAILHKKGPIY